MNRPLFYALLAGSAAALTTGYVMTRRSRPGPPYRVLAPETVIPILDPVIDSYVADRVLIEMARLPGDEVTLVLHTGGGCMISSVMIANALREFRRSTAIVPHMALSGGTLIALNAHTLKMGRSAALSAVDPLVGGIRARHVPDTDKEYRAMAMESEEAMNRYLRETLRARLEGQGDGAVERAMRVFLGWEAPHAWPIGRPEIEALGIEVGGAGSSWAAFVDALIGDRRPRQLVLSMGGRGRR
ncbi:MAG: hypothetical protein R3B09_35770 [Nannocystaceae bacterium]